MCLEHSGWEEGIGEAVAGSGSLEWAEARGVVAGMPTQVLILRAAGIKGPEVSGLLGNQQLA